MMTITEFLFTVAPENTKLVILRESGCKVTVKCEAEGVPEPTYEIVYNGTIINKAGSIEVDGSNAGSYICRSSNMLGSASITCTLLGKILFD